MLEPALVFVFFLAAGAARMPASITFGDSGEFSASAAALGLPHSPGYPLYCLLAKSFGTAIPWGNWAYRTNLLSVLCGAAALVVLLDALRRMGFGRAARLCGVLAVGLTPLWAYESSVTEVFALNSLALAGLIWVSSRFAGNLFDPRPMALLGLILGLGLSNHHTLILLAPAVVLEGLGARPGVGRIVRGSLVGLVFAALGMMCYLYLPLRSMRVPPLDWGHPTTLHRFMRVFLRKDYGSFSLTVDAAQAGRLSRLAQVGRYVLFTVKGFGMPATALALLGYGAWRRLGLRVSWVFPAAAVVMTGPLFLVLGNPPFDPMTTGALERFYLSSWVCAALLVAAGAQALEKIRPNASWAGLVLILAGGVAFGQRSSRANLAAYDYGRNLLRTLPPGASLFMDGGDDTFYCLAFLTYAQGRRTDLDLHDRGGLVFKNPYGADFRSLTWPQKEARRIEVERPIAKRGALFYSTLNASLLPGTPLATAGLLRKAGAETDPWDLYPLRWVDSDLSRHYRDRALVPVYPFMRAEALAARGDIEGALRLFRLAWSMGPDVLWLKPNVSYSLAMLAYKAVQGSQWELAGRTYAAARRIAPEDPELALGLGVVHEKTGDPRGAEELYLQALKLAPGSGHAYENLGSLYWSQSRWSDAAKAFEAVGKPPSARFAAEARRRALEKR